VAASSTAMRCRGPAVAVVGQTVLTNWCGRTLLGETLRSQRAFEVIGILEPKGVNYAGSTKTIRS